MERPYVMSAMDVKAIFLSTSISIPYGLNKK